MTVNLLDFFAFAFRHQIVLNRQHHLAVNFQRRIGEQIERVSHGAFGGILNRHHAIIGEFARHLIKNIGEARLW